MQVKELFGKKNVHCTAVVLAAGSSSRMGSDKMLMSLGGIPVLARTLLAFEHSGDINDIIVVTRDENVEKIAELCARFKVSKVKKVIAGGNTRMESALAGVSEAGNKADYIAIHDGARPFVTGALIKRTLAEAQKSYAAIPVVKSVNTLKSVDESGAVLGTLDRNTVMCAQTPQIFEADLIRGALTNAVTKGVSVTDDSAALEALGIKTQTVEGDDINLKITTRLDMVIAAAILKDKGGIV